MSSKYPPHLRSSIDLVCLGQHELAHASSVLLLLLKDRPHLVPDFEVINVSTDLGNAANEIATANHVATAQERQMTLRRYF
jgi:hypothetical protein